MVAKLSIWLFLILFQARKCTSSQDPERAVLQGTRARLGQFPYVVMVDNSPTIRSTTYWGSYCTGTILTELWVVTGAHCYTKYALHGINLTDVSTVITAATIDLNRNTTHTQIRTSSHHVMMDKNPKKEFPGTELFNNDILILKVTEPFVFNAYVGPATVGKRPLPEGRKINCIVVGFGDTQAPTEYNTDHFNTKLYYTYGTLDGNKHSCKKRAKRRGASDVKYWGEEHLCMDPVDYRSTPCHGDSGGPLVCDGLDVGTSVARFNIDNKNSNCGNKGNYHVYMFLGFYENWLKKRIPGLLPFKLVKAGSPSKKRAMSGVRDTRFRVANIEVAVFIGFILVHL